MFNLLDYKQGEEVKERLDRLENKLDILLQLIQDAHIEDYTIPDMIITYPEKAPENISKKINIKKKGK